MALRFPFPRSHEASLPQAPVASHYSVSTFVDVILPIPLDSCLTYRLPMEFQSARVGCRVVVPLGTRKFYSAVIYRIHQIEPRGCTVKDVEVLLDREPVILDSQIGLWTWMAQYYLCSLGEVYNAAMPSGMKLESETMVSLEEDYMDQDPLSPLQERLTNYLALEEKMPISRLKDYMRGHQILPLVRQLLQRGIIRIHDEITEHYRQKTEHMISLSPEFSSEDQISKALDGMARCKAQEALLLRFLDLIHYDGQAEDGNGIPRSTLLRFGTPASIRALTEKGILREWERKVDRFRLLWPNQVTPEALMAPNPLSKEQQAALEGIRSGFLQRDVCLLHGVTSSGKTEIYIHLISEMMKSGRQVLYLLPEIALTTQITERLRRHFGDSLGIYHSQFPDSWRVEIYKRQLSDHPFQVILGVRSSVLLPFRNLGLVIVDEEHEGTYKQQDPAPRYHARDTAIMLARSYSAKVLLGSATPSLESWYNATENGKYHLVQLKVRYRGIQMPKVLPVNIQAAQHRRQMHGIFSPILLESVQKTIREGGQVILFQNRRGFAPLTECEDCGWIPKCQHCDVSLTYHKGTGRLTCHYCGYTTDVPAVCPSCGNKELSFKGFGTEKVEEEISDLLPSARVLRLDQDTGKSRKAYEEILGSFQRQEADILIGTQMISKGLDFGKVRLVGILNADIMLNYPDFRSQERSYQLMAQVSGRAGRKEGQGLVLIQTRAPEHPVIRQVMANDYEGMSLIQLSERQAYRYPPYWRLIAIYLKSRREEEVEVFSKILAEKLKEGIPQERVLGPDRPVISRIKNQYIRKIIIKLRSDTSSKDARAWLRSIQERILRDEQCKSLQFYYDVDPY